MTSDSLPFVMAILFFTVPARISTASPRARYEINGDTPSGQRHGRRTDGSLDTVAFLARTWFHATPLAAIKSSRLRQGDSPAAVSPVRLNIMYYEEVKR